ncbi:MAG: IS630 family transposase [Acetobacteraceae bacterium]
MRRNARATLRLRAGQRELLAGWVRAHGTPQQVVKRRRIVMLAHQGWSDAGIAGELELNRHTCRLRRERFMREGAEGMWEVAEGPGRKPQAGLERRIVEATVGGKPAGQTHWSNRTMAKAQGVDASTVCRIWQQHGLQPHRQETFKLSRDPQFVPKLLDAVGVYLNPPQNAVVLCVDENSQIQALDRTQPGLPMKWGRCGTWTHDDVRHGTTTLCAALNVAAGTATGRCFPHHRHHEFLRFRRQIDAEYEQNLDLHLALDNYGTHKTPQVERWLARHPRFHVHFLPTSSSRLNMVERWFGDLTGKAVHRGSFASVADLVLAIEEFIAAWNRDPRPFIWQAPAEDILAKIERRRRRLEAIQPGCTARKRGQKAA